LARALPYELQAQGRVGGGKFWIDLVNNGAAGAVFQVYDNTDQSGPWRYTIESGKSHSTSQWHDKNAGDYDLSLHGPNGFFRQYRGRSPAAMTEPAIEASLAYEAEKRNIVLTLRNLGDAPHGIEVVQDAAYPLAPGEARRRVITVQPGENVTATWDIAAADHWYDLTVTAKDDATFLRRFAGHMETGKPSKTDPAIGAMHIGSG
jgi:phospholipase C